MIQLSLGRPARQSQSFLKIGHDYIESQNPKSLFAGFAYVTVKGVEFLLKKFNSEKWRNIDKQFLVGINQGITEPQALNILISQPKLRVRAHVPNGKISPATLFDPPYFHPKVMLFKAQKRFQNSLLIVSSANLTGNAIGPTSNNYECGQVTTLSASIKNNVIFDEFDAWWTEIWNASLDVNRNFLHKYSRIRLHSFKRNPDLLTLTEPSSNITKATSLWIEVGKGSGIARHQIEFPVSLASFFGKPVKHRVDLKLQSKTRSWSGRPLSHKITSYGVHIWRLGMPTIKMGGEPIQDRVIRFTRTPEAACFKFEVADVASKDVDNWMNECSLIGHLGRTGGARSRRYGYL